MAWQINCSKRKLIWTDFLGKINVKTNYKIALNLQSSMYFGKLQVVILMEFSLDLLCTSKSRKLHMSFKVPIQLTLRRLYGGIL